jgi:hypothetical protein
VRERDNNKHTGGTSAESARRGAQGARSGEAAGASSDGGRLADPAPHHHALSSNRTVLAATLHAP